MSADPRVLAARAEIERRRKGVAAAAAELIHRADPRTMASEAAESLADNASRAANTAIEEVRDHPVAAGAAGSGLALFMLWRRRRRRRREATNTVGEGSPD